jgi:hypothetical protein
VTVLFRLIGQPRPDHRHVEEQELPFGIGDFSSSGGLVRQRDPTLVLDPAAPLRLGGGDGK